MNNPPDVVYWQEALPILQMGLLTNQNKKQDDELRVACAKAALPYVHGKVADKGKKQTKAEEAQAAAKGGGKFGTLGSQLRS